MQNIEQIRAGHAIKFASNLDKKVVNKLPALIMTNGLLAAFAFCKDKRGDLDDVMQVVISYLMHRGFIPSNCKSCDVCKHFTSLQFIDLHRITVESLAYISYLKRFADKKVSNYEQ